MRKIIAVDFDGTLCKSHFPDCGEPYMQVIHRIKAEQASGSIIILWTCRSGNDLEIAVEWCKQYGLVFDYVNENAKESVLKFGNDSRKIFADEYWDDKSFNPLKKSTISII